MPITAHWAIEALQIAVDDEGQVIELFAGGEREPRDGLRLVHFAITKDAPDVTLRRALRQKAACLQIADKAGLIDRIQRPQTHRSGRELPETRHQPRMRIGTKPVATHLLPVVGQLLLGQAPFQERPRINTGRRVRLKVDEIAVLAIGTGPKKVVESDFKNLRS